MRTSGGRGLEGWIMAIPIAGLITAMAMNRGGVHEAVLAVERVIHEMLSSTMAYVAHVL
jgi:hypothetical protein